jgi:hypothetical protein
MNRKGTAKPLPFFSPPTCNGRVILNEVKDPVALLVQKKKEHG